MMQTRPSKRSQRSSHNPYRDYDDKIPANPFLDEKEKALSKEDDQSPLSPMFIDYLRKKTAAPSSDLEKIDTANISDKYHGIKIAHTISPVDGKTLGCDREHTFDTFVDQRKVSSDAGQTKRVGHGWQVARAMKRVLSSKGRDTRRARRQEEALPQGLAA
ncbi:uncharacterized protein EKO05_0006264 [Ascochyta rabiei]|uniref:Uncharacterized protein n=1 Tax=Didymella rabiei TaxID=5454 RepID=A0A163AXX1_DIDRA|nr:uncharacterized protein EKO05_0006264 [Ascochyta rabiei]KZM21457.1 hypothetical protein ST47_g7363 [Ascochyta rabiei]UPX15827.1 hypothetical protein EKO05_0006264 [Ascochyta rabiei]